MVLDQERLEINNSKNLLWQDTLDQNKNYKDKLVRI